MIIKKDPPFVPVENPMSPTDTRRALSVRADTRRALSVREFCQLYGLSRQTAYNYSKQLQSVLVGRRRLIVAASAEALLGGLPQ